LKRDYYEVLGINRSADEKTIKKAFRIQARELHPDVNTSDPEAEVKFKEAAEAYEVLSNPESRATYDRYGHDGLKGGGFHDFSQFSFEDIVRSFFGDSFFGEDLFGGRRGPGRGGDAAVAVEINLNEAATGIKKDVSFDAIDRCESCDGTGAAPGASRSTCTACNGHGQVRNVASTAFGQFVRNGPCRECGGAGSTVSEPCPACGGRGVAVKTQSLEVEIPAGIADGQNMRMPGRGSVSEGGGAAGDLYIQVSVKPHETLVRDGSDLIFSLPLTVVDAAIGATVTVPTLEGEEEIEIKPGTQFNEVQVLRGRGMPFLQKRGQGDLKIVMDIMVPRNLSAEQKDLLRQFDESTSARNYSGHEGLLKKIRAAFR